MLGQALQQVQGVVAADRLHRVQGEASDEHAELAEQAPLRVVQQVEAPGDGVAQGPLPGRQVPGAAGQQVQALVEALGHLGRLQRADASGRQLERQRQAVQPDADLPDGGCVGGRHPEVGPHRAGPLQEERQRLRLLQLLQVVRAVAGGQRHRGNRKLLLRRDPQSRPAGDQDLELGRRCQQLGNERRRREQVLEVVQDQQHLLAGKVALHGFGHRGQALLLQPQGLRHRGGHQLGIPDRRQEDDVDAVVEAVQELAARLDRQAALAGPSGAGHGDQAVVVERLLQVPQLRPAADERADREGQVVRMAVQRAGGGGRDVKAVGEKLVQVLGPLQVLQPVLAEIGEADSAAAGTFAQHLGGLRDQGLPSVCRGGDARRPVNVETPVGVPHQPPLTGVKAHPDADPGPAREGKRGKRPLPLDRRLQRRPGVGEDHEERVTLGGDLDTAEPGEHLAQQPVVRGDHLVVSAAERLKELGGALHVAEEEGDGAGRQGRVPGAHRPACLNAAHRPISTIEPGGFGHRRYTCSSAFPTPSRKVNRRSARLPCRGTACRRTGTRRRRHRTRPAGTCRRGRQRPPPARPP